MAEEHQKSHECETNFTPTDVDTTDRGMFHSFLGKKEEEKPQEEVISAEFEEKVKVSEYLEEKKEEEDAEKKPGLLEKLHRSHSSSSSSSSDEEEVEEGGEKKKKKKKGLKEKLKEKIEAHKKEDHEKEDTSVPIEKCDDVIQTVPQGETVYPEEKKGFLEKIKGKLPGQHKKTEEATTLPPPPPVVSATPHECAGEGHDHGGETKEKKGFLEKIKEKLPGYHKNEEEKKDESAAH